MAKTGPGGTTVYLYDAFGRLASEYASTAPVSLPCTTCYVSYDYLGSVRMVTDAGGTVVARHDYLPFGEETTVGRGAPWGASADPFRARFTGQERDGETGLDFFHARYYGAALGRFTSPDPGNAGADLTNPQSWNAFSYVANNPLTNTDPTGLYLQSPDPCYSAQYRTPCGWGDNTDVWGGTWPIAVSVGGDGAGAPPPSNAGASAGSATSSSPLPPGSFPGGETAGLPPGMTIPGIWGLPNASPFGLPLAPSPIGVAADTIVQTVLRSVLGPVLFVELLTAPSSAGGRAESVFEKANNDFYKQRRAIRAFYSEHLNPEEIDDCDKEWQEAIRECTEEFSQPKYKIRTNMYGKNDIFDCARGRVPKRCGGHF